MSFVTHSKWKTRGRNAGFSVRPGVDVSLASSGRSNLSFEQWMQLDLEYIDRWSLALTE